MATRLQQLKAEAVQAAEIGNFPVAAAQFAAAIELCPGDAALHEQHAQCLMELEEYEKAMTAAETATTITPAWPDAWLTLARCYLNTGQLQSAQAAFNKCLALNPDQPEVAVELSEANQLVLQQISGRVGLPGLKITADPAGQHGPGCVIWEAGIVLAQLLAAHSNQQQQRQHQQQQQLSQPGRTTDAAAAAAAAAGVPDSAAYAQQRRASSTCDSAPVVTLQGSHQPAHANTAAAMLPSAMLPTPFPCCVAGAHVLEVGSGTGVVGITAATLGAHVMLTDLPELQHLLAANIAANQQLITAARGSAAAAVLDWDQFEAQNTPQHHIDGSSSTRTTGVGLPLQQAYDWATGADLVFNHQQVVPVVRMISALLDWLPSTGNSCSNESQAAAKQLHQWPAATQRMGSQCHQPAVGGFLLAHKHRHEDVDQQLMQELAKNGLRVQLLAAPMDDQHHEQPGASQQQLQQQQVSVWWVTNHCRTAEQNSQQHMQQQQHKQGHGSSVGRQDQDGQQQQHTAGGGEHSAPQQQQQQMSASHPAQCHQLHDSYLQGNVNPQKQQHDHARPRKLLLLSAGLAGIGKSIILRLLCAQLGTSSVYVDKDTINAALLQGQPYFSDYYRQHVQQQTYAAMFGSAADNIAAKEECVVVLDGQFGDKSCADYIKPHWQAIQKGHRVCFGQSEQSAATMHAIQWPGAVFSGASAVRV